MNKRDDRVNEAALPTERAQPWQPIQRGSKRAPVLDHARFTAGIIGLYEAVLNEPIPQRMCRLIEEIRKQEHKS